MTYPAITAPIDNVLPSAPLLAENVVPNGGLQDDLLAVDEHGEVLAPPGGIVSHQIDFDALPDTLPEIFSFFDMNDWNKAADTYLLSSTSLGGVNPKDLLSLEFHRNAARIANGQ
jgi:hypothetical protein